MRLQLFGDRLFVIFGEVQEKKIGSIIIPGSHSERSRIGEVVGVGPGVKDYVVGDKVLASWYSGTRIHLDGDELYGRPVVEDAFRILVEQEILGKVLED
jgi:co-chaperonin GroES (HSP10)